MKRLILVLFLIPCLASGAFTEFYMTSGGANINAGSTTGNSAVYTSTNGNWSTSTNNFTPTDGSTPASSVNVGDFASLYVDGATTAVYIARVTVVAAGVNGAITVSTTAVYGTAPTTSATARSIKVGGAWVGPGSAVTFPFSLLGTISSLLNASGNHVRLNAKNDQTYTMTAALPLSKLGNALMQGYTSTPGDGGKATFTSNITSGSNFTNTSASEAFIDLIFANTGASNASTLFDNSGDGSVFLRCVFHGARGSGLNNSGAISMLAAESEAYDCNKSNTAAFAGFSNRTGNGIMICLNCYSHDHTSGSNADNFASANTGNGFYLINSTADSSAGIGLNSINSGQLVAINSNFYNNTGDAVKMSPVTQTGFSVLINNNFLKNGGKAINITNSNQAGIIYNNGRGSGTQANGSSDALGSIVDTSTDITYASGVTPWNAPTTGDFSTNLAAAQGAGRGAFTETDGTNTGTVGYTDIGAAQALPGCTFPTPTATATFTPTPTATATASFTPCAPTPGPTATSTPTPTPTATSTSTPTPTPSPTAPIETSYGFPG